MTVLKLSSPWLSSAYYAFSMITKSVLVLILVVSLICQHQSSPLLCWNQKRKRTDGTVVCYLYTSVQANVANILWLSGIEHSETLNGLTAFVENRTTLNGLTALAEQPHFIVYDCFLFSTGFLVITWILFYLFAFSIHFRSHKLCSWVDIAHFFLIST